MGDSHTAFIGSIPEHYDQYLGPLILRNTRLILLNGFLCQLGEPFWKSLPVQALLPVTSEEFCHMM